MGIAHSGSFSYDGKVLIFGHEPGGGTQASARPRARHVNRTLFFYEPETGTQVGTLIQPRPQTAQENCTWHNFNVVPTYKGRTAIVGSYQMGITAIDFTDPAAPPQFAFADPAPLARRPGRAATGRPTGTTASCTRPTSAAACSSGTSTTSVRTGPGH